MTMQCFSCTVAKATTETGQPCRIQLSPTRAMRSEASDPGSGSTYTNSHPLTLRSSMAGKPHLVMLLLMLGIWCEGRRGDERVCTWDPLNIYTCGYGRPLRAPIQCKKTSSTPFFFLLRPAHREPKRGAWVRRYSVLDNPNQHSTSGKAALHHIALWRCSWYSTPSSANKAEQRPVVMIKIQFQNPESRF
ncbi:hypothetical protein K437DRAFT_256771 [Tilletiaria anomala UBC 951]|uniref:Uncharacterized protein n=1 Tax=Tilletiaria anomala (strain ATCC 24038 / CBS 436.72 / UBC 951) TaxID=1037660 RepID=A0A066W2T0_TILAU|nr:uncharacterized protein K437DRAFT_256771 [Tilletiaria anomala UBC 951]KDN45110.1 hypothetical protein K437DRAFT_256771 [Tilletiaria anomala UBC 951]